MQKVSVIIPVFNVASYLRQCLDSCVASTLKDVEFICINDGSTDQSLSILEEYSKKDGRFIILSQENTGQGIARNKALQIAKGEYIAFVDPDDWIHPELLQKAYTFAVTHQANVVQFNYTEYREHAKKYKKIDCTKKFKKLYHYNLRKAGKYNSQNIAKGLFYNLYNQVWNRIYKRDFLLNHHIQFATTRNGEDHLFTIGVLSSGTDIYYLDEYLYMYRVRLGSACHTWGEQDITYTFENIKQIAAYLKTYNLYTQYESSFRDYCVHVLCWARLRLKPEQISPYETLVAGFLSKAEFHEYQNLCQCEMDRPTHRHFTILKKFILQKLGITRN